MAYVKDKADRFRLVSGPTSVDFNKIKVGKSTLSDNVSIDTEWLDRNSKRGWYSHRVGNRKFSRQRIEDALYNRDLKSLREISSYYFDTNGMYMRLCRYMAFIYRYDFFITPIIMSDSVRDEKVVEGWYKSAAFLENCDLKKNFGRIALKVIKNGCYYGVKNSQASAAFLQELPIDYCRSRYELNGSPAVEFNIKYFDDAFSDMQYRMKVLKMFPKEFQKAYIAYKNGTLAKDFNADAKGWFLVDPSIAVKFNLCGNDAPLFAPVIPALLDLEDAQELDKKKMKQQLLRILVQKLPIDKNGDLVFDVEEGRALHQSASEMLQDTIGVDVLTTFADVKMEDMSDNSSVSSIDQLDKIERTVYNEAGVSQMQFNTSGNIALEKSILNDEATMTDLLAQFETYAETLLAPFNRNPKKLKYKVEMLPTTVYNYKDLSKLYKEQTMIGFSKLLPQVALGQSQSVVISTAYFENKLMHLEGLFVPPQMSSTMSGNQLSSEDKEMGRPEKKDDEKSDKTLANEASGSQ